MVSNPDERKRDVSEKREEILDFIDEEEGVDQEDVLEKFQDDEEAQDALFELLDSGNLLITPDWKYKKIGS